MNKIAVIDFETDPFEYGLIVKPFSFGFWDGERYIDYWGDDAPKALGELLLDWPDPLTIYAHNGGKFDFLFLMEYLSGSIRIVNGRILEATLGKHTLRDSYGILPIKLSEGKEKDEIDYQKLKRAVREGHKDEILKYQKQDCIALHNLVSAFIEQFGDVLTIGTAAMKALSKLHKFDRLNQKHDEFFRRYYFGGRCQCFDSGILKGDWKVYDVNSMYPHAMKQFLHPIGFEHCISEGITANSSFVCWEGQNNGAVPMRAKNFGLDFTVKEGIFWSSIHEFNMGLETNTIIPRKIKHAVEFAQRTTFDSFVDYYYGLRLHAKNTGNVFNSIFYKLILNSAYGKFAQNPENYVESIILPYGELMENPYIMEFVHDKYAIWSKPVERFSYYNVSTAASITGAARAVLLKGLSQAVRPVYCDTDAIICEGFSGDVHKSELGKWDLEKEGDTIAIAGKKMYALTKDGLCVKLASKGVRATAEQIFDIARGEVIEFASDAPAFKLDGKHVFITRKVKRTV